VLSPDYGGREDSSLPQETPMKRKALLYVPLVVAIILALTHASYAQLVAGPGVTDASSSQPTSNRTFSFSGTIPGQLDGALSVTFSIYPDQQSTTALWTETQVVQVTGEKYSVMLGSTVTTGLPPEIFSADQAHWLGVQVNGSEKRFLLVSVPYAMKAVEAERLGGLLPTDFVTVQQLQSALQSVVAPGTSTQPKATSTGPTGQAAAAGTPPQPATDFTDNNTSEVLLVTQQGTGYAIHAITSSQAEAILAQNDSIGGTALHAFATNATGTSIGVLAETTSPNGIAGVFNNRTGGKILSLRNNGVEVASADVNGNLTASGQVQATTFSGGGFGLFGIPQSAINATPFNNPSSVVARDSNGSFAANQVTATTFSGGGFGLFGIPQSAINATPLNDAFSVVARDQNGSFAANQITATTFSGGNLQVMNQLTSSGFVDFSGAVTAPVRTVLTANIPPLCFTSKELLLVTDAVPGQQLFVCNSNGNGWVLLGDGGGSAGSSNVSGNTTGTLENVSQLGSGTALTVSSTSGTAVSASSTSGMAIHGDSTGVGVQGSSQGGIGVWAAATANDSTGTALLLSHASQGKLIDGGVSLGSGTDIFETFSVTAEGDVTFNGAMMTPYETTGTWFASSLVKLTSIPGNFGAGTVAMTSPGDTSGVIGIISGLPASGSRIQVVQSGQFFCNFDGPATSGHYVGISKTTAGDCTDIGASYPTDGQQVVGRVLSSFVTGTGRVLLFQSELHGGAGGAGNAITINTGAGLTGGPITGSGTISIANSGVTNAMLQNSSVTITPGPGLAGGGPVSLGGTVTLSNTGVLSLNGRVGSVTSATGDYSFAQISGSAAVSQLPATVAYSNQANTFTGNQTVNGSVTASSFSGSGSTLTGVNAATLNGFASGSFAQVAAANTFAAKQTLAASTTASASLNVPAGSGPSSPVAGDLWNTGSTVQYRDNASTTRSLVSTTQSGGLQLLKLTASITPASVASQGCTEQSFTVSGISSGDVLLSVLQPSTSSPGANIAIGGFRVSAANTVAVQFCNVSRNNSTPTAGVYTFAFMR
jgi:hypothetical protein